MDKLAPNKLVIGITGNIGSGKSRVSRYWSTRFSVPILNIDRTCRRLMKTDGAGFEAIKKHFGTRFSDPDDQLDRVALREAIFSSPTVRKQIDELIHPLAQEALGDELAVIPAPMVLVEVPLLFEAGWQGFFDQSVMVYASRRSCCERVISRDKVSCQQAHDAVSSQMDATRKILLADHVINNDTSWAKTILEIIRLGNIFS